MAKSTYLDNLINGKLPDTIHSTYLNRLWRNLTDGTISPVTSSIFTSLTNDIDYILIGSDYLNSLSSNIKNNLVTDMSSTYMGNITLDKRYLPIEARQTVGQNKDSNAPGNSRYNLSINTPPEYLPAIITRTTNGENKNIPILFPKSFSRSIQANFAKESPVGSTSPITAYSYTGAESIPIEFDALSDYLPAGYNTLNEYVEDIISLLKPKVTNSTIFEPTVTVTFADISFSGICESVSISYDNLYDYKSFTHAIISCQFTKLS